MGIVAPSLYFGESAAAGSAAERSGRWAGLPYPVLILGESGTGKTALALRMHVQSGRRGAFVDFSMAQVAANMEVAELCGYRRGAFTGADQPFEGIFEQAHLGTAFLDELGLTSLTAQGVLLKILDTKSVRRIGENRVRRVDFRLIAATNADLGGMTRDRAFLAELVARFGFYVITLPPLRARRADILPLAMRFLEVESARCRRLELPRLSSAVVRILMRAPWPGNIRDLENVCAYLVGNAPAEARVADLPPAFLATLGMDPSRAAEPLAERARRLVTETGSKAEAARRLRISRGHLYRVLGDQSPRE